MITIEFARDMSGADSAVHFAFENEVMTPVARQTDVASGGALTRAIEAAGYTGKTGKWLVLMGLEKPALGHLALIGVGDAKSAKPDTLERAAATAYKHLAKSGSKQAAFVSPGAVAGLSGGECAARMAMGAVLASYRFDKYRTTLKPDQKPTLEKITVVTTDPDGAQAAFRPLGEVAQGVRLARDLVSEPANVLYPESFAAECEKLAELGVEVTTLSEGQMRKLGMEALLGVGQGSARESKLVVMRWSGAAEKKAAPVAFVGKGVTFDTGGISLKPSDGMWDMKGDMGGAAAVTGVMRALAGRKAAVNVVGVVGLVENMPDAAAQRPGDIVTSMSGQTIEVLNTDAEGRLVLSDALTYTQREFKPKCIVDLATLTGAILVALGQEHAGLFCSDDAFANAISKAGQATGETVWRLPLGPVYDRMIDTPNADMKNIGAGRMAGSITAAQFLKRFIEGDTPWAHLDIAGTGWKSKSEDPREPVWATGWGVRILDKLADDQFSS